MQAHIGCYRKMIVIRENSVYTDQLNKNKVKTYINNQS